MNIGQHIKIGEKMPYQQGEKQEFSKKIKTLLPKKKVYLIGEYS